MIDRFKKWFACLTNLVQHEEQIQLELSAQDLHVGALQNITSNHTTLIAVLTKRANAAEFELAGQKQFFSGKLAQATADMKAAQEALDSHNQRVTQMEALTLRKAGMAIRRS